MFFVPYDFRYPHPRSLGEPQEGRLDASDVSLRNTRLRTPHHFRV